MSKLSRIKAVEWFLAGGVLLFAILFPQGVFVCIDEPSHVELEILGGRCCEGDSDLTAILAGMSTYLPTNTCADCNHIQITDWHHYSNHRFGKSFGKHRNVWNQAVYVPASTFGGFRKLAIYSRLAVADPIPPLLLEHLSTSILIC